MRRGEWSCDADNGNEHYDRDTGDAELSEYAHQLSQLRGRCFAERGWTGDDSILEREHHGSDADG